MRPRRRSVISSRIPLNVASFRGWRHCRPQAPCGVTARRVSFRSSPTRLVPSGRLALVRADTTIGDGANTVYQLLTDLNGYYGTVGVATAGYPVSDTQACPDTACTWAPFSLNHALFAYSTGANDPQNIAVRDPFYTRWVFFGGIGRLGAAVSAETAVTSSFTTTCDAAVVS